MRIIGYPGETPPKPMRLRDLPDDPPLPEDVTYEEFRAYGGRMGYVGFNNSYFCI